MLLAIDVGNTTIHFGLFRGVKLVKEWRVETLRISADQDIRQWVPENQEIRQVVVASVVPRLNKIIKNSLIRHSALGIRHLTFVTASNIPRLKVRIKNKNEVGADRAVNALAAYELYGGPAIVVDFGTATTFDVITAKGEYRGGVIAPGIIMARDALHERTAKLPLVKLKAPHHVVGRSTVEAMQSGLVFGYVAMVEGLIKNISSALGIRHSALKVIATGGLAPLICKSTKVIDIIDDKLTLKGLALCVRRTK